MVYTYVHAHQDFSAVQNTILLLVVVVDRRQAKGHHHPQRHKVLVVDTPLKTLSNATGQDIFPHDSPQTCSIKGPSSQTMRNLGDDTRHNEIDGTESRRLDG
jgi:hypothetical protein